MGDNVDYNTLFGLESTEGEGGNEQTVAGSDVTETDKAAEETEEETAENETAEESGKAGEGTQSEGKPAQSPEENSRYAAARRKAEAERDAAVQKAITETRTQMQTELEDTIKALGMINPYTKKPIATKADLDEYRQRFEIERKSKFAKKAGMNDEEFQQFVNDLPEVKEARAKADAAEAAQRAVREKEAQAEIDRQLGEIREIDPSITSLSDLTKMPNYQRFYDLVKRGNTLTDAFRLVNMDRQTSQVREQAQQAALNKVASKSHLDRTTTRGAGAVTVPADVMEQFRIFNPDATDEEIRKYWAKSQKK